MRCHNSRNIRFRGFTLIELIVVIILLAILSAVIMPNFLSFDEEASTAILDRASTTIKKATIHNEQAFNSPVLTSAGAVEIKQNTKCWVVINKFFPDMSSSIKVVNQSGVEVPNLSVGINGANCHLWYKGYMRQLDITLTS